MKSLILLIEITTLAGVIGTGIGGLIGALFKKDSSKTASLLLSFAAGVMTAIVCFDLIIGAVKTGTHVYIVSLGVIVGCLIVYLLNLVIDKSTNHEVVHIDLSHPKTADDLDEIIHSNHLSVHIDKNDTKASLFIAGVIMASAIALHNLPEGMTIGASFANTKGVLEGSALVLAILIGMHNVPEGMAIAVPLINGGMRKCYAILTTALTGLPTVIGGVIGYLVGDLGALGLALSLSFASGAMLYVVFAEILPQSILMYRSKLPAFFVILGIIIGLIVIYI